MWRQKNRIKLEIPECNEEKSSDSKKTITAAVTKQMGQNAKRTERTDDWRYICANAANDTPIERLSECAAHTGEPRAHALTANAGHFPVLCLLHGWHLYVIILHHVSFASFANAAIRAHNWCWEMWCTLLHRVRLFALQDTRWLLGARHPLPHHRRPLSSLRVLLVLAAAMRSYIWVLYEHITHINWHSVYPIMEFRMAASTFGQSCLSSFSHIRSAGTLMAGSRDTALPSAGHSAHACVTGAFMASTHIVNGRPLVEWLDFGWNCVLVYTAFTRGYFSILILISGPRETKSGRQATAQIPGSLKSNKMLIQLQCFKKMALSYLYWSVACPLLARCRFLLWPAYRLNGSLRIACKEVNNYDGLLLISQLARNHSGLYGVMSFMSNINNNWANCMHTQNATHFPRSGALKQNQHSHWTTINWAHTYTHSPKRWVAFFSEHLH